MIKQTMAALLLSTTVMTGVAHATQEEADALNDRLAAAGLGGHTVLYDDEYDDYQFGGRPTNLQAVTAAVEAFIANPPATGDDPETYPNSYPTVTPAEGLLPHGFNYHVQNWAGVDPTTYPQVRTYGHPNDITDPGLWSQDGRLSIIWDVRETKDNGPRTGYWEEVYGEDHTYEQVSTITIRGNVDQESRDFLTSFQQIPADSPYETTTIYPPDDVNTWENGDTITFTHKRTNVYGTDRAQDVRDKIASIEANMYIVPEPLEGADLSAVTERILNGNTAERCNIQRQISNRREPLYVGGSFENPFNRGEIITQPGLLDVLADRLAGESCG